MSAYLMLKIAGLLIVVLLLVCVWLYVAARQAEEAAELWRTHAGHWRKHCRTWRSTAVEAGARARKATGFAQDAVDALATRQEELDRKDAEIARLYGACKHFVKQEQHKHRLWREALEAGRREPAVWHMVSTIRRARNLRRETWEN